MYVFSSKPASLFSMSMQYEHAVCICRFAPNSHVFVSSSTYLGKL